MPASLYELNTRVRLNELSASLHRPATLDDLIPDADRLADLGFDWIWLMGIWQTGAAGRNVSRTTPEWQPGFREQLPDLRDSDICGSPYAIASYTIPPEYGGPDALARLAEHLHGRGLRLMLDFVPNHTALDHPWAHDHPGFYVQGTPADLARDPATYISLPTGNGHAIFARGRDPYFPAWPDALQLNYANPELQAAMTAQLAAIAHLCDGVRCDMAMLLLPDVFRHTWNLEIAPFWAQAIVAVRRDHPDFTFMAEVYWGREWDVQQLGFDYTYDKTLYDRLREGKAQPLRDHLAAPLDYQRKLVRFLENHDEPRAAAVFSPAQHRAAAVITYFTPGLRFFHDGQLEGRRVHASIHLCRRPPEPADTLLQQFYADLLPVLDHPAVRHGDWQLLPAGNASVFAFLWTASASSLLAVVNYTDSAADTQIGLPHPRPAAELRDRLSPTILPLAANQPLSLNVPAWGFHLFDIAPNP